MHRGLRATCETTQSLGMDLYLIRPPEIQVRAINHSQFAVQWSRTFGKGH
jgi:hypothetical protein